jgi:hypothetical protein
MATMSPVNSQWEIVGNANGPELTTSLGSCSFAKFTGTIPANGGTNYSEMPAPTVGSCTAGASLTLGAGKWYFLGAKRQLQFLPESPMTLRYASLPGCKLTGGAILSGLFVNGTTAGTSIFVPGMRTTMTWQNDGGTCALSGQTEAVSFEEPEALTNPNRVILGFNSVKNLTNPSAVVWVSIN